MVSFRKPHFKKFNKKVIIISTIITVVLVIGLIPYDAYAGLKEILEDAIGYVIAGLMRLVADGISGVINDLNAGIDKLVFNVQSNFSSPTILKDGNITLLRNNSLSTKLMGLYQLFVYIAASMLSFIGLFIVIDFKKTGDDSRHLAVLRDRLKKLVISIVLLTAIPTIFDELMVINQLFIDVFRLMIMDSAPSFNGLFLSDLFKQLSLDNKDDIAKAAIYLMSTFLNGWMVIFYMIRDLTISLLFIIAPVLAVMLPYRADLLLKWLKEMCSNIFTQSIQAFIMAIVISIASSLGDSSALYDQIFALVAFAMFIPLTATIKKMIGLEGDVGAAKSNAGLGAATAAIGLATATYAGIRGTTGKVRQANQDIKNIKAEENLLDKSDFGAEVEGSQVSTSRVGGANSTNKGGRGITIDPDNRSASNRNHGVDVQGNYGELSQGYSATSRARELQGIKSNARKERTRAVLGGLGSAIGGGIMAAGASVYGNPFNAMMAARVGGAVGMDLGEATGSGTHKATQLASEKIQDNRYGKGIRYDGEQRQALTPILQGTDWSDWSHPLKNIQSNFEIVRSNNDLNKEIIDYNRDKEQGYYESLQQVTGLDESSMSPDDFKLETEAILKRNELERRGDFGQAHRTYARKTYDRNKGNSNVRDIEERKERARVNTENSSQQVNVNRPVNKANNTASSTISKENSETNYSMPDNFYNEMNEVNKSKQNIAEEIFNMQSMLDKNIQSYENITDTENALDDMLNFYENINSFGSNDNSQFN